MKPLGLIRSGKMRVANAPLVQVLVGGTGEDLETGTLAQQTLEAWHRGDDGDDLDGLDRQASVLESGHGRDGGATGWAKDQPSPSAARKPHWRSKLSRESARVPA